MPLGTVLPFLRNRLLGTVIGTAVGFAASDAMSAPMRSFVQEMNRRFPNVLLTPDALALGVVRSVLGFEAARAEAEGMGLDGGRFGALVGITSRPPGLADALTAKRRGLLNEAQLREAIAESDVKAKYAGALVALERVLLSPAEAAQAVASNALTAEEGGQLAGLAGMARADFDALVLADESAPTSGQVLDLLNRGELDEGDARAALRRNGLEPRWADELLALRNVLPPVTDLIRFMVREVFTPAVVAEFGLLDEFPEAAVPLGRRIGLTRDVLEQYWAAHWELPSTEQGFEMFHRDVITRERLRLLLRTKDVMPVWRGPLEAIAYRVPGRIDLRRMFVEGVIGRDRVLRGYQDLGYDPADAAILTAFAVAQKQAPERELAKGEITALYEQRILDRPAARARLRALGYSEDEADAILALADARARSKLRTATITVVRGRFVAREIDRAEATARLDAIGLPPAGREEYLSLWEFERAETPTLLTEAQARAALARGLITEPTYRAHLARLGYEREAIDVLVQLAQPRAAVTRTRDLTRADILRDYRRAAISRAQAAAELGNLGYDAAEADRLLDPIDDERAGEPGATP